MRLSRALGLSLVVAAAVVTAASCGTTSEAVAEPDGGTSAPLPPAEAAATADAPPPPAGRRPNIVFVLSDDQRADSVACMPQLQARLAAKGTTFRNSFAATPLCCPGRTSILTGKYAHNHGVETNGDVEDGEPVKGVSGNESFNANGNEALVFTRWLHDAGYRTGLFGKYLNGYTDVYTARPGYVPPHWDEWRAFLASEFYNVTMVERGLGEAKARAVCYETTLTDVRPLASCDALTDERRTGAEHYSTDVLAGHAKAFIERAGKDKVPFFLYFAPKAPHGPFLSPARYQPDHRAVAFTEVAKQRLGACPLFEWANRPPSFLEEDVSDKPDWVQNEVPRTAANRERMRGQQDETRKLQLASALATEDALEVLMQTLEATGQAGDTIIVYSSDNGFGWGEHWWGKKNCAYDACSRVPLIVYDPRHPQPSRVVNTLAMNIDLAPTFAELAGVTPPTGARMNGQSLAGLVTGASGELSRAQVLTECWGGSTGPDTQASVRTDRYKYVEHYEDASRARVRTHSAGGEDVELYDLSKDPSEVDNLLRVPDATLARLGTTRADVESLRATLRAALAGLRAE